uniref:MADS-box domain-containing protein n=1 Tax=Arcella intermedia TaxID=1963864 RepID=A0A6B2L886_9EUKA
MDNSDDPPVKKKKQGRRKINIEFIDDKSRRQITFSKRKAGIMKKAYELTTLTGTQALLLIASETGHVYTFATPKLQPFVTRPDGKALIQRCLNSPDPEGGLPQDDVSNYVPPVPSQPEQLVDDSLPPAMPPYVESSLVLVVGKTIPVAPVFTAGHFKDLQALTDKWSQQCRHQISCLAGGYPSMEGFFRSPNDRITSEIVIGLKVAEVDYTSPHQPSFSIEKLSSFLEEAEKVILDGMWHEIGSKPYVVDYKQAPQHQEYPALPLAKTALGLHVVSTYPNAHVNVVFGVRKQGENGKGSQVVGISCQKGLGHVCKLEIDERFHEERLQMMGGVDGVPYYHLLPDILK